MNPISNTFEFSSLEKKIKHSDYLSVSEIRTEIRKRRKHILGSHVSVLQFVCSEGTFDVTRVDELSGFLAERTVLFLGKEELEANIFCRRFYTLSFYALASGNVGDESIDDVIQLAECVVRSRDIFTTVLRNLLPEDMISELFHFSEEYDNTYLGPNFEDAVLGAIAVLLGVLADPINR